PQELTGKHLREIYPSTIADHHMNGIRSILDQGINLSYEIKESFPTGERWLDARMTLVKTGNGTVIGVLGISNDITERKRVEEALRESEELFKSVVHNSSDLTILADAKGIVTFVSPQCENVLGYPGDKFIGQTMPDIIYPDDVTRCRHAWEQVVQHGQELQDFEYRIVDGAGAVRWISHSAKRATVDGRVLGIQSDICNITERKLAEVALGENEERLRTILHSMQTGIIVIDAHTHTILDANQKSLDMIGGTKETVLGTVCHSYICPAELGKCPFIDITERKLAADTIALTNRKLALMNDMTYQYIQNKVTGLRGYAELSNDAKTDAERIAFIEKEKHVLADIHHLIKNTRDYQEIGLIQPRWIPVEKSIRMAVSLVSQKHGISVETALHGLELYSDPIIEKIFSKLIENAVKHGKTTRRITFSCKETPDGFILICEDDGVGISPAVKARLFDQSVGESIRFGLFFIRECLDLSGMTITETGEPGKGARFEIHIPAGMWRMKEVDA
ncbi:MAG: PAS domain S-box protein, partial [Methanoregula sp.]|nr:PAS domain S-box protein [Methanoregula sp.]